LARLNGIFLGVFLLLLMACPASPAQNSGAAPTKKTGTATAPAKGGTSAKAKPAEATKADSTAKAGEPSEKAAPLPPEVVHRIQNEIRSHYNVPQQIKITVSDPKPGNVPGYDDLTITLLGGNHSSNHEFLISKDRKTLAHMEKYDVSEDLMSKIDIKGRPVRGNPDAKVTIVNYDDFQCPFCSRMHSALFAQVFKDYADRVKVVYKDYPLLEIHPWAMRAAIDGNCLGEQNGPAYWDFADYVHANQKEVAGKSRADAFANLDNVAKEQAQKHQLDQEKLMACVQKQDEAAVRASMSEGDKLGVDSTPTLFINGERFTGVLPEQELRAVLDRALADNGQAPPADAKK
jgi:protein-disulfide isomerase